MTNTSHTPGPWFVAVAYDGKRFMILGDGEAEVALVQPHRVLEQLSADIHQASEDELANARLIATAPELLAYAECEEAKRVSLLPTDKGGTGNGQSYMEVFNRHGWDGRDVYGFLDKLRRTAIAKARAWYVSSAGHSRTQ